MDKVNKNRCQPPEDNHRRKKIKDKYSYRRLRLSGNAIGYSTHKWVFFNFNSLEKNKCHLLQQF